MKSISKRSRRPHHSTVKYSKISSQTNLHDNTSDSEEVLHDVLNDDNYVAEHCHTKQPERTNQASIQARKTLIMATVLCLAFMIAEIIGGGIAGSLAIMTDAAHLLTDVASFLISLFSLYVSSRPPSKSMSFGWHRAEVFGALVSVLMIWIVTGVLCYIATERIINKDTNLNATVMLITAGVGVLVNILMGIILHKGNHAHSHGLGGGHGHSHGHGANHSHHEHNHVDIGQKHTTPDIESRGDLGNGLVVPVDAAGADVEHGDGDTNSTSSRSESVHGHGKHKHKHKSNINVRAALIHVIGDLLQSIGVFIAALIIYFKPNLSIIDPVCTYIFSLLVLATTIAIMRDTVNVLMEGIPRGVDIGEVTQSLEEIRHVKRVHDLRIWSLTVDKTALSVHLAIEPNADANRVLSKATKLLVEKYNMYECTVQIERFAQDMDNCVRCEALK